MDKTWCDLRAGLSLSQKARSVDHTKFHRSPELGASFIVSFFYLTLSLSMSLSLSFPPLFVSLLLKWYGKAE